MWKYQCNIALFDPSARSQGLSRSCLLILGPHCTYYSLCLCTATQTPFCFYQTHFLLLSHAQEAILLHSSEIIRKITIIWGTDNCFHSQSFILDSALPAREQDPKATWHLECPIASGIDLVFWVWINKLGTMTVSSSFTSQSVPPSSSEERLVLDLLAPRGEEAVLSTSLSSKLCRARDTECPQTIMTQSVTAPNNISKPLFQPNE